MRIQLTSLEKERKKEIVKHNIHDPQVYAGEQTGTLRKRVVHSSNKVDFVYFKGPRVLPTFIIIVQVCRCREVFLFSRGMCGHRCYRKIMILDSAALRSRDKPNIVINNPYTHIHSIQMTLINDCLDKSKRQVNRSDDQFLDIELFQKQCYIFVIIY